MQISQEHTTAPSPAQRLPLPQEWETILLHCATSLSGVLDTETLARRLRTPLSVLPRLHRGGLGLVDRERELLTVYSFPPNGPETDETAPLAIWEEPADAAGVPSLAHPHEIYLSPDLAAQRHVQLQERLLQEGVRRYVSAPMLLGERLLGGLYAGFAEPEPIPPQTTAFVQLLARIVAPVLWNCHSDARFRHGDQRRDTLIDIGNAINRSLKLQAILDSARQTIRNLRGHCFSAIKLLDEHGRSYRSYRNFTSPEVAAAAGPDPKVFKITGTAMEWVLQHGKTYQSGDLATERRFAHDGELLEFGVRRYVAAPMFVRGRVIGSFLIGSTDPRRVLNVDIWLYENVALQLALAIDNARQLEQVERLSDRLAQQNVYLREEIQQEHDFSEMIGRAPPMQRVLDAIARVAGTDTTVLVQGETGVGKELVARALHAASPRSEHPMVKVNCAAIPESMVESELFGHERGAFTSAVERRIGRFELARDGTLFLDEIGELSLAVQAKLLRVLQDGEFERVGGSKTLSSNARIIAATNRDLLKCVHDGTFRSDLYYRLNVFPIEVPPLRERRDDIPLLVEAFVAQFNRRMGKRVTSIEPATMNTFCRRDWPGNIRELRHVIERALILCDGAVLRVAAGEFPHVQPTPAPAAEAPPPRDTQRLIDVEADHIRRVLEQTGGVVEGPRGAARLLGLKPSTLRFRMKRLGVERQR